MWYSHRVESGQGAWRSGAGLAPRLVVEQRPLALQAPAIATQRAILTHHAVAGHDHRHGVGGASPPDGTLGGGNVFAECTNGVFDGFRFDRDGRIWTSAADGVHCYDTSGALIGKVMIPELVANVCFGGPKLNRLFICGTTSLYSVFLNVNGVSPIGVIQ